MMTLFEFLRKVRAEGADITKMKIRIKGVPGGWGNGFKINSLKGNRMSIQTDLMGDFPLQSGHVCLRSEVVSLTRTPFKRMSDTRNHIMVIDLAYPIGH